LEAQRSPTGEKRQREGSMLERLLSPAIPSQDKPGPIPDAAREVVRLGHSLTAPPLYEKVGDEKLYYTADEREALGEAQRKALEAVAQVIKSPGYQRLPDEETPETKARGIKTKYNVIENLLYRYKSRVSRKVNAQAVRRSQQGSRTGMGTFSESATNAANAATRGQAASAIGSALAGGGVTGGSGSGSASSGGGTA
jgi:hypothetical protein